MRLYAAVKLDTLWQYATIVVGKWGFTLALLPHLALADSGLPVILELANA